MQDAREASTPAEVIRAAIDIGRLPWVRPLVKAQTHDYESVAALFAGRPTDPGAWHETIARVQRVSRDRDRVAHILQAQLAQRGAPPAARTAAAELAAPRTVAVVTGQQAGIFGGPLYTLLKAVTAIQLARRVRDEHGVPAIALFWVDAEDHDWEEIRTATLLDRDLSPVVVKLEDVPGAGSLPAAALTLDARIGETLDEVARVLAPTEFSDDLMSALRRRYCPGTSVSRAFAGWVEDLLGPHGLVVFEASDPAAKPLVADLFVHELRHPAITSRLTRTAASLMTALGHAPQVEPADDAAALFYLDGHGRRPLKSRDAGFLVGDALRAADQLRQEATSHPARFSPNVLLRPLVQDRLFPTVCYVAGPSELAYQAQLGAVYREFGVEAPLLYSRASATLLDAAAMRFLERQDGLPLEALRAQDDSALNRLLETQLPASIDECLTSIEQHIASEAARLKDAVTTVDPTLAGAVETTVDRVRETLKTLQGKIVQASKRKDETLRRQFTRTRALAFPGGEPQERIVNVAFFVNRYGPALCQRLIDTLPLETDKHYVLTL